MELHQKNRSVPVTQSGRQSVVDEACRGVVVQRVCVCSMVCVRRCRELQLRGETDVTPYVICDND